ncbi:helix-turn-helix domain-containing protein [Perlabentimonas gracilis]|uniref:helix-turn-helix domain-containing protein n=1 Tax=Perlabentimonas gracilis TaxID=2715279 RepID=UPI00140E3AAF|nr:helix-turn-helix transcriptional regulator [Perlabentimonas gracilis]NHB70310.1 helix-turn-helix transcriptional regulator [Perlabentimonas gracilis]
METVVKRIIKLRRHRQLSQKDMANKLGINLVSYSKYERGITSMSVERLQQIADILKVDINYFFFKGDSVSELLEITDKSFLDQEIQEEEFVWSKEYRQIHQALAVLKIELLYSVAGLLNLSRDSSVVFYSFLRAFLKGEKRDNIAFAWFLDFIQIYNLEKLKSQYKDFFDLLLFEDNPDVLGDIVMKYTFEKDDKNLSRLLSEWHSFFEKKLHYSFFSNDLIYSFIERNEKDIRVLNSVFDYGIWLEYKKSKEQG